MLQSPHRICLPQPLSCVPHFSAAVSKLRSVFEERGEERGMRAGGGGDAPQLGGVQPRSANTYSSSAGFKPTPLAKHKSAHRRRSCASPRTAPAAATA